MIVHSHEYNTDFYPALPEIEIQVRRRVAEEAVMLTAIVDSGADATMMPMRVLQQLKARKLDTVWLQGVAGGRYQVDLYALAVQIGDYRPIYVDVVGSERGNEIIVGRDFLNHFAVMLNGLAGIVEVSI